jgi:hypothetical protein
VGRWKGGEVPHCSQAPLKPGVPSTHTWGWAGVLSRCCGCWPVGVGPRVLDRECAFLDARRTAGASQRGLTASVVHGGMGVAGQWWLA